MRKPIASFALVGMIFINTDTCGMTTDDILRSGDREDPIMKKYKNCPLHLRNVRHFQEDVRQFTKFLTEGEAEDPIYGKLLQAAERKDYGAVLSITKGLPENKYKFFGAIWFEFTATECGGIDEDDRKEIADFYAKAMESFYNNGIYKSKSKWVSDVLYRLSLDGNNKLVPGADKKMNEKEAFDERQYVTKLWRAMREIGDENTRNYIRPLSPRYRVAPRPFKSEDTVFPVNRRKPNFH
jgi:hypothetical protein